MTIWICPSEFISCKQDWREREIRKASSMAGMAKEKERKKEEKATQPKSLCFPPLSILVRQKKNQKDLCQNYFSIFYQKMWVNPSKLVVKPQWLLSVATRGPNSGPAPPPTTSFWLCSAMNLLRETFWYHLQKGISLSSGIIPREGRRHCQVAPKRRKKSLTRHMRRHNFFRLSPIHLISGLSYSEVKKITMKFVKFPYYFHGFVFSGTTPHLHFPLCTAQDKAWLDILMHKDKIKKKKKLIKLPTIKETEDTQREWKIGNTDICMKILSFQMKQIKFKILEHVKNCDVFILFPCFFNCKQWIHASKEINLWTLNDKTLISTPLPSFLFRTFQQFFHCFQPF